MAAECISVSKADLRKCFRQWETEARAGECLSPEETAAKTVDQVAGENADHFWQRLSDG